VFQWLSSTYLIAFNRTPSVYFLNIRLVLLDPLVLAFMRVFTVCRINEVGCFVGNSGFLVYSQWTIERNSRCLGPWTSMSTSVDVINLTFDSTDNTSLELDNSGCHKNLIPKLNRIRVGIRNARQWTTRKHYYATLSTAHDI
jgi:hypothetical protein